MSALTIWSLLAAGAAIGATAFWAGHRTARRRTSQLEGAAQSFCIEHCRLPDGRCPLLRSDMRREDCPLWRLIEADAPTRKPVDTEAPLGAGPYRNPEYEPDDSG
jgi:hypothetical protein